MINHDPGIHAAIGNVVILLASGISCFFNRTLKRNKLFAAINIAGAVLMAVMAYVGQKRLLPEDTFVTLYVIAIAVVAVPLLVLMIYNRMED